jgi:hypothetical protein
MEAQPMGDGSALRAQAEELRRESRKVRATRGDRNPAQPADDIDLEDEAKALADEAAKTFKDSLSRGKK